MFRVIILIVCLMVPIFAQSDSELYTGFINSMCAGLLGAAGQSKLGPFIRNFEKCQANHLTSIQNCEPLQQFITVTTEPEASDLCLDPFFAVDGWARQLQSCFETDKPDLEELQKFEFCFMKFQ
ncbi:uncharacterized protein LOC141856433 [Brevipalpus obovatus]|uniref:uncharacterized protein LOC141856433 n=1 Tax=Brevipalpus obovatus TaxID=246614 RepID=UPI003D9E3618